MVKIKNKSGITLIALIVTIIVLIILSSVTILMVVGENGIIKQAIAGKEETKKASIKEMIEIEVIGSFQDNGKLDINLLNNNLANIKGLTHEGTNLIEKPIIETPVVVELEGVEVIISGNRKDNKVEIVPPAQKGKKYYTETVVSVGNKIVTIPEKFTISGLKNEGIVEEGLVIYLIPEGITVDWNNPQSVEQAQKTYDQFVWVPVENVVAENDTQLNTMIKEGKYPMAVKIEGTDSNDLQNYRAVLYDFSGTTSVTVSPKTWSVDSTSNREPAFLTNKNYGDLSSYNNVGITQNPNVLQEEFNEMIDSVKEKKGFWVGRYETSNMTSDDTKDASTRVATVKGTKNGLSEIDWYRMYIQQKRYSQLALGEKTTITSSIIWGCQWDQIMIWMKDIKNETSYAGNIPYYILNSKGMGNYATTVGGTGELSETGYYAVNNIYDLAGNLLERTLEANTNVSRVSRRRYGYI